MGGGRVSYPQLCLLRAMARVESRPEFACDNRVAPSCYRKGWLERVTGSNGRAHYRITEAGREALRQLGVHC